MKVAQIKLGGVDFIRQKVRDRDNNTCQQCGKIWVIGMRRFDVHHLDIKMESIKDYRYDRDNQDKMITYCHKCHLNLHTVRQKMSLGQYGRVYDYKERNANIFELRKKGMTQNKISKIHKISRERVRQILLGDSYTQK